SGPIEEHRLLPCLACVGLATAAHLWKEPSGIWLHDVGRSYLPFGHEFESVDSSHAETGGRRLPRGRDPHRPSDDLRALSRCRGNICNDLLGPEEHLRSVGLACHQRPGSCAVLGHGCRDPLGGACVLGCPIAWEGVVLHCSVAGPNHQAGLQEAVFHPPAGSRCDSWHSL
ncbi:yjjL, partial [Symbiodinium sp. CCMP2456]